MDINHKLKAEIFFRGEKDSCEVEILYECDPDLNTECKKI